MIIEKLALPRRTFLRGVGATLALPLLDAMTPALTALDLTPSSPARLRRLGYVYMPMGCDITRWTPPCPETLDSLSPTLSPLEPVKRHVTAITNLELPNVYRSAHATSICAFLSAASAKRIEGADRHGGTTVDQIAAAHVGGATQLPSLELSIDLPSHVGQCDNDYACVYQNNLSWSSSTTPLPSECDPRTVFERLFGDGLTAAEGRTARSSDASLLDSIGSELSRLQKTLGPADRSRLGQYAESVRDVERRIQRAEIAIDKHRLPDLDRPLGVPASYAEHARLMFDLQLLALQGDITRVVTFQLAREMSNRTYPEIGVFEPHHPLTHHGNDPAKIAKMAKINQFHVSLFAEFLQKLSATPEAGETLLDHVLYLYGSGMGDPNVHDHTDLPILVAGGGAGQMRGGRHIRYDRPTPLANLHLALLKKVGTPIEQFAHAQGGIDELLEPLAI